MISASNQIIVLKRAASRTKIATHSLVAAAALQEAPAWRLARGAIEIAHQTLDVDGEDRRSRCTIGTLHQLRRRLRLTSCGRVCDVRRVLTPRLVLRSHVAARVGTRIGVRRHTRRANRNIGLSNLCSICSPFQLDSSLCITNTPVQLIRSHLLSVQYTDFS